MTMASRMSLGPLSARNGAKAGETFVSLVIVVVKYVFSIKHTLVVLISCDRRDNDTPNAIFHMPYFIWHMKYERRRYFPLPAAVFFNNPSTLSKLVFQTYRFGPLFFAPNSTAFS